jgi:hypothetical protein
MNNTRTKFIAFTIATITSASLFGASIPAQAAEFTVTADKTINLALTGQLVNVAVSNLPAGTGIYLRVCAGSATDAAKARPTACTSMGDTAWVTTNPAALGQGAKPLTGPVALNVPSTFLAAGVTIDCAVSDCGIAVRRDHLGGAADFSLDRFIPITFAAATVSKTGVVIDGSKVNFTILNQKGKKVSFIVGYKKYTKVVDSDNYTFTAKAPKDKQFTASAFVGSKKIVGKKLKK